MKRAIASVLVVLLLFGGFLYVRKVDQEDKRRMNELYTAVEPLQREREALTAERDSLETAYALQMRDPGTVELLFRELDARIFTDVYPKMRDRGIVGVLGISKKQYPGFLNKLSTEQFSRLLRDGWGSCLIYENTQSFERWYTEVCNLLEKDNLPVPKTIFFPDNTYDESLNETLESHGFETVIHNAEDGHSATVTAIGEGLWHTGAMPWNYTGVNADTDLLSRTNGANLVFTIGFENLWDSYESTAFDKVLATWASMLASDDTLQTAAGSAPESLTTESVITPEEDLARPLLRVVNLETARALHEAAAEANSALAEEQAQRERSLDEQIQALDRQIRELYEKWGTREDGTITAIWHKLGF